MLVPRMMVTSAYGSTRIDSLVAVQTRAMSCVDSWQVTVDWVIHNPNNTLYSLSLFLLQPSSTTLLTNQTCAAGSYMYDTMITGDPTGTTNTTNVQFRLQLIQRSDSAVIQTFDSNTVTRQWTACPP